MRFDLHPKVQMHLLADQLLNLLARPNPDPFDDPTRGKLDVSGSLCNRHYVATENRLTGTNGQRTTARLYLKNVLKVVRLGIIIHG